MTNLDFEQKIIITKSYLNKTKFTGCCKIILYVNFVFYVFYSLNFYELTDYSLSLFPVKYKYQIYRMVSNYFIHLNLMHFLISSVLILSKLHNIEKMIGTVNTIIYVSLSTYITSIIYLILVSTLKYILNNIFNFQTVELDFKSMIGLTSIYFSIYTLECNYSNSLTEIIYHVEILKSYKPFYLLVFLQFINPKENLLGHISGIYSAKVIVKLSKFIFPSINYIKILEKKYSSLMFFLIRNLSYVSVYHLDNQNYMLNNLNLIISNYLFFK
jgi:membrane associated rhomboid family serine protease